MKLKNILISASVAALCTPLSAQKLIADLDGYHLSVKLDHADCIYSVNEPIVASVTLTLNGEPLDAGILYTKSKDNYTPTIERGELALTGGKATVTMSLDEPGFMMLRITYKTPKGGTLSQLVGAGVDPYSIGRSLPEPDDFQEYWTGQRALQAAIPENIRLTPVPSKKRGVIAYDVQADCLAGNFSGFIAIPENAAPKSLPALVSCHGAGVASSRLAIAAKWAEQGIMAIDFNVHGLPNDQPRDYYRSLESRGGELHQYYYTGTSDRNSVFFRRMILRLMKALDIICARPEWDGEHLIAFGRSQGGAQALIAGGIDPRVKLVCAEIPALCDLSGAVAGRSSGWPRYQQHAKEQFPARDQEAVRYVDAMNFAPHIKGISFVTCGFIDLVCPPTGVFAVYNTIPGEKHILHNTDTGHITTKTGEDYVRQAVKDYLEGKLQ